MDWAYHRHHLWVYIFGDYTTVSRNVLKHLMQRLRFDLLSFQFCTSVVEVE